MSESNSTATEMYRVPTCTHEKRCKNVIFNGLFSIVTTAIGVNASHNIIFRGGDTHNAIMTDDWNTSPLRCHPIRTRAVIEHLYVILKGTKHRNLVIMVIRFI